MNTKHAGLRWRSTKSEDCAGGFTLIELLVVIAVIAILAAMLLPSLSIAKLQAQQTSCVNNLKQIDMAHIMYLTDFHDNIGGQGFQWENEISPYLIGRLNGSTIRNGVFLCPSAPKLPTAQFTEQSGTADTAWGNVLSTTAEGQEIENYGAFAFNLWCASTGSVSDEFTGNPDLGIITPRKVRHVSLTPVFADAIWHEALPNVADFPSSDLYNGDTNDYIAISDFTIARHGNRPASAAPRNFDITQRLPGMIDVALYDGHVEKSPLENLWHYYWSATWYIPNPRPR